MRSPRVSVLLPVRDAAPSLEACLASLRVQTLDDHEVLAVDDGSSDASREILRHAARGDPRLRVLDPASRGLVAALNTGLAAARAPLIARMDADDLADARRLELQAERLAREPELQVLGCRVRVLGGADNAGMRGYVEWSNRLLDHEAMVRDLFVEAPLVHPSAMLRRDALVAWKGWRDFGGPEDYDLWLRAHAAGARFAKLEELLLDWRDGPLRLTRRDPRYRKERFLALKAEFLARGPLAPPREAVIWGAGKLGKAWARALLSRGRALRAFVEVDPRKIGARIHGVPVLAADAALALRGPLHLAAVGQPGARERIRSAAAAAGLREPADLVAVA